MLPWLAILTTVAALVMAALAVYVAWRRGAPAGVSLSVVLAAAAVWGVFYAVELSVPDIPQKTRWGDLKWLGVCALPPAWLVFVLQYTGRGNRVTARLLLALTVEPVVVLALLFNPGTHDRVRFYDLDPSGKVVAVGGGPVFWAHLAYSNAVIVLATAVFVVTMVRLARTYRRVAVTLVAAAMLPWIANLLYNFEVGSFARIDLTPFAFSFTGGVLVWGLFRQRLVNLTPLARSVIVDTMSDSVFVLDAFGRLADVNPAGAQLLGRSRGALIGRPFAEELHERSSPGAQLLPGSAEPVDHLVVGSGEDTRAYDVRRQPLSDASGAPAGELVVLRDITDVVRAADHLHELLAERSRVAAALQASLVPRDLPSIPWVEIAGLFEPAGDGSEIGGDFLDVFPLENGAWGLLLGDVSGKGAEAAAVTALTRYTLRTLADLRRSPSDTLRELNARLLGATSVERHCTLVYAVARPTEEGLELTMSLAGHHPPLVLRASGIVEPFGECGTAMGLVEDPELYDTGGVLGPDDLICMFTDGLVEARRAGELFESHRVAALLAESGDRTAQDIAVLLAAEARRFEGHDLADDLAILALRSRARLPQQREQQPEQSETAPALQSL